MTFKQFFTEAKIQPLADRIDYFTKNPHEAVNYAETLGTEWDKIPGVPKDKAQKIIDGIAKYPVTAGLYSTLVMKRRWPEAEPVIANHGGWAVDYANTFFDDKRWTEMHDIPDDLANKAEESIIVRGDEDLFPDYLKIIKGRWPLLEDILNSGKTYGRDWELWSKHIWDLYIQHLNNIGYTDDTSSEYQ